VTRERRVAFEAFGAGGPADQDRGGQRPAAGFVEQLRAMRLDQAQQLELERVDAARELTDVRELLARDPASRAVWQALQATVDAIELGCLIQRPRAQRLLELGAQRDEIPAQAVLYAGALGDQRYPVI
jgi:hypothetical protein